MKGTRTERKQANLCTKCKVGERTSGKSKTNPWCRDCQNEYNRNRYHEMVDALRIVKAERKRLDDTLSEVGLFVDRFGTVHSAPVAAVNAAKAGAGAAA